MNTKENCNCNFEDIKSFVLAKTGLADTPEFEITLKGKIAEILAYCQRDYVPNAMLFAIVDVLSEVMSTGFDGNMTSYKEGDMSINFGGSGLEGVKYNGKLEGFKLVRGANYDIS